MSTSKDGSQRKIHSQVASFCLVGVTGTAVHYAVLFEMVQVVEAPVVSSATGFVLGGLTNFILNHRFTFASGRSYRETVLKFFGVACVGLVLNVLIMTLFTMIFKIHFLVAQIVATGLVLLWNYFGNRVWTFSKENV